MVIEYKIGTSSVFLQQLINYNIEYYYFNSSVTLGHKACLDEDTTGF